ncbi:MAG: D-alanyl-D-alanine carboxypeptidase family protein, partial [Bacilli bacterium]|nr:D-alanyl-D-alanine carboxypeptidase family protein [Bacilli bacterium]
NKDGEEKEYSFNVVVEDRVGPVIEAKGELSTEVGTKIDLLKNVKVTDDSGETIKATVEGSYDFNKVGTYNLNYVAKDSSGNETKKEFKLVVKEKKVTPPAPTPTPTPTPAPTTNPDGTFTTSKGFKGETKNGITYINGLIIANKTYSLPSTYAPGGLTSETKAAADRMFAAAASERGFNMWAQSGFRSYDTQKRLYNNYVNQSGKAAADTFSARPGHSEHQTGLAFDVCAKNKPCINSNFDSTEEAKWLSDNAYKYGFILRYPSGKTGETGYKFESWHFRYVGVDLATQLYNGGNWITLENYLGITSQYSN